MCPWVKKIPSRIGASVALGVVRLAIVRVRPAVVVGNRACSRITTFVPSRDRQVPVKRRGAVYLGLSRLARNRASGRPPAGNPAS